MKKYLSFAASLLLITLAVGCGDSYDKVAADLVTNVQAVRDTLKTVKDVSSAKLAAEKIKSLAVEMDHVKDRMNKLGKPTKEQGDELNSKYKSQIADVQKEISAEHARIEALGPEVLAPIETAMKGGM